MVKGGHGKGFKIHEARQQIREMATTEVGGTETSWKEIEQ